MKATALVRYDAMCRAIAEAFRVDDVKAIRDKAVALEQYARQARNTENERKACEVRLRAERKAGKLARQLTKAKGGRPGKTRGAASPVSKGEQLTAAGITKDQAKTWERLARVPDDLFEEQLGDRTHMPTTNSIIRAAAAPQVAPVSNDALWLWGRLRDFERDLLSKDPAVVMETLTEEMRDSVHTLAPRVAAWLRRIGELPWQKTPVA